MAEGVSESEREAARLARKQRRQERRRERILDAARQVLRDEGVQGFTMAGVARAADLSKPSVYYYFDSREALVGALAERIFERELALLMRLGEGGQTGLDALHDVLVERTRFYVEDLEAFSLVYLWPQVIGIAPASLQKVVGGAIRFNDALEQRLLADQAAGTLSAEVQPRLLANVVVSTSQGILQMVSGMQMVGDSTRFTAMAMAEEAARNLVRGARGSASS